MHTSLGQGSRECGLCPEDSVRPWIGPWTRVEFLAQKSGQNARVVVVAFRRRSGSRTAPYLLVSIPICSNAHTLREAALTARVTSRRGTTCRGRPAILNMPCTWKSVNESHGPSPQADRCGELREQPRHCSPAHNRQQLRAAHARAVLRPCSMRYASGTKVYCVSRRGRPCTPSIEGPHTEGLARDRPPTCERQRQAVGKQCTAVGELLAPRALARQGAGSARGLVALVLT